MPILEVKIEKLFQSKAESQNGLGWKEPQWPLSFNPPCYVQGHQPPDQAAQSHIQPGFECLQGWGIHSLLGQPVPVLHHPVCEGLLYLCLCRWHCFSDFSFKVLMLQVELVNFCWTSRYCTLHEGRICFAGNAFVFIQLWLEKNERAGTETSGGRARKEACSGKSSWGNSREILLYCYALQLALLNSSTSQLNLLVMFSTYRTQM